MSSWIERRLNSPGPWIGVYVAAASALCTVTMAADAFNAFRSKRLWLPCKYFSLNAFSLTVLAVAMKIPVDLTNDMMGLVDVVARVSSLAFMITSLSNFTTSLGCMGFTEMVLSIIALDILVITVAANVCVHDYALITPPTLIEDSVCILMMLLLLGTLCSLAVMIPSAKNYLQLKYKEMHKMILDEEDEWRKYSADELGMVMKRYWVMAATSNPQLLIARSALSAIPALVCPLSAIILAGAFIRFGLFFNFRLVFHYVTSNYNWSLKWIFVVQSVGVAVGSVAPLFRLFFAARFKSSEIGHKSLRDELKVERYWTLRLVEWRNGPFPVQIRNRKLRNLLNRVKRLILSLWIGLQIAFVVINKLFLLISAICVRGLVFCFHRMCDPDEDGDASGSERRSLEDLSRYALLLEGEPKLTERTLRNICKEMDKLIQRGAKNQPKNLLRLLHKSVENFDGVSEFNSSEVRSLYHRELPNCWSLPVITLTSIAIALPNITIDKVNLLLDSISEGLSFTEQIEKELDNNKLEGVRDAAYEVWEEVGRHKRWQGVDLRSTSLRGKSYKEALQNLSAAAEKTVGDFVAGITDFVMQNPLNWPVEAVAASSMYRIAQTVLLSLPDDEQEAEEEEALFERLSRMISDILAACLTNLTDVMVLKCQRNEISEWQENVEQATVLLGESREILEFLQQRGVPNFLDRKKAANIDEWIAILKQGNEIPIHAASTSAPKISSTISTEEEIIELEG